VLPPLLSTGAVQSLNFGIFENSRTALRAVGSTAGEHHDFDEHRDFDDPMWIIAAAAFVSGAATSPLTAVSHKVKLLQQVHGTSGAQILRDGLQRLKPFRHFPLHCALEAFGRACYLSTYFASKRAIARSGFDHKEMRWRLVAGATAGVVAWASIYPLDVLRSRLYSGSAESGGASMAVLLAELYREGALFRGLGFTLLRAAPVAGVVLNCYDIVLEYIRRHARVPPAP
jgi:hypothetical protein